MSTKRKPRRIYLAGPMTGIPQFNFPAFDAAARDLRGTGLDVVSPAELDDPVDRAAALQSPDGSALSYGSGVKKTWGQFLGRDVVLIADGGIEAVYVLPGWAKSRGARLETFVARAMCGLPIFKYDADQPYGHGGEVSSAALVRAWAGALWPEVMVKAVMAVKEVLAA